MLLTFGGPAVPGITSRFCGGCFSQPPGHQPFITSGAACNSCMQLAVHCDGNVITLIALRGHVNKLLYVLPVCGMRWCLGLRARKASSTESQNYLQRARLLKAVPKAPKQRVICNGKRTRLIGRIVRGPPNRKLEPANIYPNSNSSF